MPHAWIAMLAVLAACEAGAGEPPPDVPGELVADPELPPQGHTLLHAWLGNAHYRAWACEPEPHPARPPGAHGANRICSNALLSTTVDGAYPVGAASVKELYRGGALAGYAVGIKVAAPEAGSSWYWYEAVNNNVVADGIDRALCSNCHEDAARDYIFTRVGP